MVQKPHNHYPHMDICAMRYLIGATLHITYVIKKYKYHNCGVIFRKAGSKTGCYDTVARVLFEEVKAMATMLKMVKEQKLSRRQSKRTQNLQYAIFNMWEKFNNREMTVNGLLNTVIGIYTAP